MKRVDPTTAPVEPSRRSMLRAGAAGTAMWVTPVVFSLTATRADAASHGGGGDGDGDGGGGGGGGGGEPIGKVISHGFVLVRCDGVYYSIKVESFGTAATKSGNQDLDYLIALRTDDDLRARRDFGTPSSSLLSRFVADGDTVYENERALKLVVPADCEIVRGLAVSYDGNFAQTGADAIKFAPATLVGKTVYFRASDDT